MDEPPESPQSGSDLTDAADGAIDDAAANTTGEPVFEFSPRVGKAVKLLSKRARENVREGRTLRVLIGPRGIVITAGHNAIRATWEDVEAVWQDVTEHFVNGGHTSTDYKYTVRFADGRSYNLIGSLSASKARASSAQLAQGTPGVVTSITVEQLGRFIQQEVTGRSVTAAVDRLNRGESVAFGPLTLDLSRLGNGDELLQWEDVEDVKIRQGVISVKKSGKWLAWKKVPVSAVPNVFAFFEVVSAIRAVHARTEN